MTVQAKLNLKFWGQSPGDLKEYTLFAQLPDPPAPVPKPTDWLWSNKAVRALDMLEEQAWDRFIDDYAIWRDTERRCGNGMLTLTLAVEGEEYTCQYRRTPEYLVRFSAEEE